MGDYAKAKDFAEKALACDGELADYNTDIEPVEELSLIHIYKAVAAELGISVNTVKTHLSHALKYLSLIHIYHLLFAAAS